MENRRVLMSTIAGAMLSMFGANTAKASNLVPTGKSRAKGFTQHKVNATKGKRHTSLKIRSNRRK